MRYQLSSFFLRVHVALLSEAVHIARSSPHQVVLNTLRKAVHPSSGIEPALFQKTFSVVLSSEGTGIPPPWLAVSLWSHRQGDAGVCRIGSLLHTRVAGLLGRDHGRRAAESRMGLGTSRSKLSSDARLAFAAL